MNALSPLKFKFVSGVWVAMMSTRYGPVEVVVSGSERVPHPQQLDTLAKFLPRASDLTEATRKLRFGFLYRLIRIAPNQEGRIGLQFRNRITGAQPLLFSVS
jgi:hypothetical protein